MALPALTIACGYAGGDGFDRSHNPVFGYVQWSEEPSSGVATTNVAPSNAAGNSIPPVFRIYATADSWVSIGTAPNASASPRFPVPALTIYDIYVKPDDKLAWIAA